MRNKIYKKISFALLLLCADLVAVLCFAAIKSSVMARAQFQEINSEEAGNAIVQSYQIDIPGYEDGWRRLADSELYDYWNPAYGSYNCYGASLPTKRENAGSLFRSD